MASCRSAAAAAVLALPGAKGRVCLHCVWNNKYVVHHRPVPERREQRPQLREGSLKASHVSLLSIVDHSELQNRACGRTRVS